MKNCRLMICYVSKDAELAKIIAGKVDGMTFADLDIKIDAVYMDKPDVGCANDWVEWSEENVRAADIVMQIWTENTMESVSDEKRLNNKVVLNEVMTAMDQKKQLIVLDLVGEKGYAQGYLLRTYNISKTHINAPEDLTETLLKEVLHDRAYKLLNAIHPDYLAPNKVLRSTDGLGSLGDDFVGREKELQEINALFKSGKKVVVLHGEGGIGKTEIARRYIEKYGENSLFCYKVCGDEHDLTLSSVFLSLGYENPLDPEDQKLPEYEQACIRLQQLKDMDPRYIILIDNFNADFDDKENKKLLNKIAETLPFRVLFSSRSTTRNAVVGVIDVDCLPMTEQKELFFRLSGLERTEKTEEEFENLSNTICGHTMTIELVARLIDKKGLPLQEIASSLLTTTGKVASEHTADKMTINEHLKKLFEIADLDEIQKDVLYYLSLFCRYGISYRDLENAFKEVRQIDVEDEIDYLVTISLIKLHNNKNLYLHPLVSELAFQDYDNGREELTEKAIAFVLDNLELDKENDNVEILGQKLEYHLHLLNRTTGKDSFLNEEYILTYRIGNFCNILGDFQKTKNYYEKSYNIQDLLISRQDTPQNWHSYALSCKRLGEIYQILGEIQKAKNYYDKFYDVSERIMNEFGTPQSKRDFAISCEKLGDIYQLLGKKQKAKEYFEKYFILSEKLLFELETPKSRRIFAISCDRIGDFYMDIKETKEAEKYYKKAYTIREKLMSEFSDIISMRDFAYSCKKLGDIYLTFGERYYRGREEKEKAKEYYEKSYAIYKKLMTDLGSPQSMRDFAISCNKLGDIYNAIGDHQQSRENHEKAYAIYEKLMIELGTPDCIRDLAISCSRLGDSYENLNDHQKANEYYEESFSYWKKLTTILDIPQIMRDFAISCRKLGDFYHGDIQKAKDYYEQAYIICEKLMTNLNTPDSMLGFAISCGRLAYVYQDLGDIQKTIELLKKRFYYQSRLDDMKDD